MVSNVVRDIKKGRWKRAQWMSEAKDNLQADREELRDATKDHDDTNAKVDDAAEERDDS